MKNKTYVFVDIETTGVKPKDNEIIEIGAVKIKDNEIIETYSTLVKPKKAIDSFHMGSLLCHILFGK